MQSYSWKNILYNMMERKIKFPETGLEREQLVPLMKKLKENDANWREGKTWSLVFYPGEDVAQIIEQAYNMFIFENGLNPTAFPSLRKFETETISMAADLLGGDNEIVGNMTSGGTESILMAVKTARERARAEHPEIKEPEMVLPISAHPAFEKAAHYFDVKAVHVPLREDYRVDVSKYEEFINENTILLVGSAPAYPHGLIDPIEEIGAIAQKHNLLFHVDACVGGFTLPFIREAGYDIPSFDFSVEGVTSMSADLHKYAYAAKGASLILYRNREIRKHQYFVYTEWPGGIYASPTISGTRPGGTIAAAWAVIKYLGKQKYVEMNKKVMETTVKLRETINETPGLQVISNPDACVFAFTSDRFDIFAIGDEMTLKGWHIDRQQFPNSLHLTVTQNHIGIEDEFLSDLFTAVATVRKLNWNKISSSLTVTAVKGISKMLPKKTFSKLSKNASKWIGENSPSGLPTRTAAMYGMMGALTNRGDVYDMIVQLLDNLNGVK